MAALFDVEVGAESKVSAVCESSALRPRCTCEGEIASLEKSSSSKTVRRLVGALGVGEASGVERGARLGAISFQASSGEFSLNAH